MNSRSYQSSGPISRNDLEKQTYNSTNIVGGSRDSGAKSQNERSGNGAVYRKALDVILMENHELERENGILRKFMLLKKENCDLKTLDIITSALSMCDDKLNEFIQRMHQEKIISEEIKNHKTPVRFTEEKYELCSPSYGASFPEVNFNELRETNEGVNSLHITVPRTPFQSERSMEMAAKDTSPSYGHSFPELDTNELLVSHVSSFEPGSNDFTRSKLRSYHINAKDPLAYLGTNPYPVIKKSLTRDGQINGGTQLDANEDSNRRTQAVLRAQTKDNVTPTVPEWKRNSNAFQPGPPYPNFEKREYAEIESHNYGVKTDTRCQSAPIKQLHFNTRTEDEDVLNGQWIQNHKTNTSTKPDKEQRRSRLVKVIPRMTSTPKSKQQMSPKLRSVPATLNGPKKSAFKPIQQPHMRFSLEPPRQYQRKPSPIQDRKMSERRPELSGLKIGFQREFQNKSKRQDTPLNTVDTVTRSTVFYDSLDQDDNIQETDDNIEYNKDVRDFDNTDPISFKSQRYITQDKSVYYTPLAFTEYQQKKEIPSQDSERSDCSRMASQCKDGLILPATGNVESHLASKPIYVSSGQRTPNDYPNIAKAITGRSANREPPMFPSEYNQSSQSYSQTTRLHKTAAEEKSQPTAYILSPEKDTGLGGDSMKTLYGTSGRAANQTKGSTINTNAYKCSNYTQHPYNSDTGWRDQHNTHKQDTNRTNTQEPTLYAANDTYEVTEIGDTDDVDKDKKEDESVWINITQRGKILNEVYDLEKQSPEKVYEQPEKHFTSRSFDKGSRTSVEKKSIADDPVMAEFSSVGSPLHTSTPVASDRSKHKRFDSARQTNASPIVNEAIGSLRKDKTKLSPVQRLNFDTNGGQNQILSENSPVVRRDDRIRSDFAGNQEFELSLMKVVTQEEPTAGGTEKVKSVLYRPVDTLTGYSPNVTADLTNTVLGSSPNRRLAGEIAFQLDRRIMELVIGLRKQSSWNKTKRPRYYGYSLVNISKLMNKQALHSSHGNLGEAKIIERELQIRLENVDTMLKPLGFDLAFHSEFTQDMVNKYGLMREAPDRNTVEGFGLTEPVVLRMLLGRILGQGPVLDNMLILLDCLCFLSHSDNTPLFMW